MKLGIVGAEAAKFTPYSQEAARRILRGLIRKVEPTLVISGHSPLGGIDWWAVEEAEQLGVPILEFAPAVMRWEGGFRERNMQIAHASDVVVCIVVRDLPPEYRGRRFPHGCYHCKTGPEDHVKSGGCWTVKEANKLGKRSAVLVIDGHGPAA